MEPLSIGPFVLPGFAVHAAIVLIPGFLAVLIITVGNRELRRRSIDLLSTALLIYVVLWKLGPLVSSFHLVMEEPRLLLFAGGGRAGVLLGALGAGAYVAVSLVRKRLLEARMIRVLGLFVLVCAASYGVSAGIVAAGGSEGSGGAPASSRGSEGSEGRDGPFERETAGGRQRAPAFSLESLEGADITLEDAEGRPLVINFWATWCGPCEVELPVKTRLAREFEDEARFWGINLTTSEGGVEEVRRYAEEHEINYPVLLDRRGNVQQRYGVRGTPTTYIIDSEGGVVHKFMGAMDYRDMKRRLEGLVAEASR
ncbi:MAG: redoxin domain-containing protein [Spirochaetota bacterium]